MTPTYPSKWRELQKKCLFLAMSEHHGEFVCFGRIATDSLMPVNVREACYFTYFLLQVNRIIRTNITYSKEKPIRQHDDVIKWKHFPRYWPPRYWPFVRGIHRSPVNSPHKGQWRGDLMFSMICARINVRVNNGEAGDLRHHRAHYDVIVIGRCRGKVHGPFY